MSKGALFIFFLLLSLPTTYAVGLILSKLAHSASAHIAREWLHIHGIPIFILLFGALAAGGVGLWVIQIFATSGRVRGVTSEKWPNIALYSCVFCGQLFFTLLALSYLTAVR